MSSKCKADKLTFLICSIAILAAIAVTLYLALNASPENELNRSIYSYECVNNQCVKTLIVNNTDSEVIDLEVCHLLCLDYKTLWPRPSGSLKYVNQLYSLNTEHIKVDYPSHVNQLAYWDLSVSRFRKLLEVKATVSDKVIDQGLDMHIVITVEESSLELYMDTDESYQLNLYKDDNEMRVEITAITYYGARHGLESLSQLIVYDETNNLYKTLESIQFVDAPTYKHRGILLDTARHYYSPTAIKRTIDGLALTKLNVFHWHITDSNSFAMVLNSHPELSERGAYASDQIYTPSVIKEIVEYARVRGVRVIPEFDAPAHVAEGWQNTSLVACILAQPWTRYCAGPPCGQLDPTKNELYDVLREIYGDMNDMFMQPEIFHMGGDEVFPGCWDSNEDIRNWMMEQGWGTTDDDYLKLWHYFQERATNIWQEIADSNRNRVILWTSSLTEEDVIDEYLNPIDYIIQIWTTGSGVDSHVPHLLEKGYDIILSNNDALYLDCGAGSYVSTGNNWCSPYKTWHTIYNNNVTHMANGRKSQVLGAEACLWSPMTDELTIDSKLWPRSSALAERLWTDPDEDYRSAEYRMLMHQKFLIKYGIAAASIQPEWCIQNQGSCPKD